MSLATGSASAAIAYGTYELHNHPDGNARPPLYGARLDELFNATGGHDIFTFDFDHAQSAMFLDYDGSSIHIYGQSWGGRDIGSAYAADIYQGLYTFDFTYSIGVGLAAGDDDVEVNLPAPPPSVYNYGTLQTPASGEVQLRDGHYDDGTADFRFGDNDDDNGWRGFDGLSGWGWLFHKNQTQTSFLPYVGDSDWLFIATRQVPAPGATALMLSAIGVGAVRTRRRTA